MVREQLWYLVSWHIHIQYLYNQIITFLKENKNEGEEREKKLKYKMDSILVPEATNKTSPVQ
jgi:hypothetical protein